jgi:hypothetical protein
MNLRADSKWLDQCFRFGNSIILLLLFLFFVTIFTTDKSLYYSILQSLTGLPKDQPFGDFGAVMKASICWRQGIDVYLPNSCMNGGEYNYSPFLLRMGYLPLGLGRFVPGGLLSDLFFILSLSFLPTSKSLFEFLIRSAAAISTSAIFVLEKANIDGLIFVLTILSVCLLLRSIALRVIGYLLFILLAAIKFYPITLLIFVIRENINRLLGFIVITALIGCIFFVFFADGTKAAYKILPSGLPFTWVFGAINLPFGLTLLKFMPKLTLNPDLSQYNIAIHGPFKGFIIELGLISLSVVSVGASLLLRSQYRKLFIETTRDAKLLLIAGSTIIIGCFFNAQNVDYRAIFLIIVIPALCSMAKSSNGKTASILKSSILIIVFLMWESFFRLSVERISGSLLPPDIAILPQIAFWILRETCWWWIIIQLLAFVFIFLELNIQRLYQEAKSKLSY